MLSSIQPRLDCSLDPASQATRAGRRTSLPPVNKPYQPSMKTQDEQDEIQEDTTSMEEKLEALDSQIEKLVEEDG